MDIHNALVFIESIFFKYLVSCWYKSFTFAFKNVFNGHPVHFYVTHISGTPCYMNNEFYSYDIM